MTTFWAMFAAGMIDAMGGGPGGSAQSQPSLLPKPTGWSSRKLPKTDQKKKDLP